MGIFDKIKKYVTGANMASYAAPKTEYKGSLPKGTVRNGSKGSDVTAVQTFLNWGIGAGLVVDAICGPKTVKAIKAFQKQSKITADGIFGPDTKKQAQALINKYAPKPTPPKKKYKVIDVSEWQGSIDFKKVKADGVVGVIIRYADGDYVDKYFAKNMTNAKAVGLHVGAYIFSRAKNKAQAEDEAKRIFNACKKYSPDMPLYIDLEDNSLRSVADGNAQAFIKKIEALGGAGGTYANVNWWNNYLRATAKLNKPMWVAQYYSRCQYEPLSRVGMWQYSSSGSVKGISGRVDMNECYVEYWKSAPKPTPKPDPKPSEKKGYSGTFPSYKLVKTNAQVIADAIKWAKWIAGDNRFHYGYGKHSHHNGCFFCGTQHLKRGHGIKNFEYTYCCNPFVGAAWAHGGGDAQAYKMCHSTKSWDFGTGTGSYHTSKLFEKVSLNSLKAGDVLCSDSHVALYIGNGKVAQAGHEDDNKVNSSSWKSSISVSTWDGYKRAYRYKGSVNTYRPLSHGEVSDRVSDLQRFLVWYGFIITIDGIFGDGTLEAVKAFQKDKKLDTDGWVGVKTISAMKAVKK